MIRVLGATEHNLKDVDVEIPLHRLVCVTGVSGSGKSTLVQDVLHAGLRRAKGKPTETPGAHREMLGAELVDDVVMVDQTPIGRTTRSNPASYVGAFDAIRKLFTRAPLALERGYTVGTFSFNSGNGRCPTCGGNGFEHVEMQFLSDVYLRCPDCDGKRFRPEVLEVRLERGGRTSDVAQVLELTVSEAVAVLRRRRGGARAPGAARGRGSRLPAARPARADAVGRRGAAAETRGASRAMSVRKGVTGDTSPHSEPEAEKGDSPHAVPVRRAHHRPALRRRREAARRLQAPARRGSLAARDRAQPRRDPRRRLDRRPRTRGRRRGRARARRRHAGGPSWRAPTRTRDGRSSSTSANARPSLRAGRAQLPSFALPAASRDAVADRARDSIVVHRAREHNLRDVEVTIPRDVHDRADRRLRLRQVHARVRHRVQRGPAALPRVAQRLCAAVRAARGAAGRRRDLRHSADRGDRATHEPRRSQEHRGHADRGAPLPAPAVREARRCSTARLPACRSSRRAPIRSRRCCCARRAAGASNCWHRSWSRARGSTPTSRSGPPRRASPNCAWTATMLPTAKWPRLDRFREHTIELPVGHGQGRARDRSGVARGARSGARVRQGRRARGRSRPDARVLDQARLPLLRAELRRNPTRACSRTTPSTAGARTASAPACRSAASTRNSRARKSGGTTGSRARRAPAKVAMAGVSIRSRSTCASRVARSRTCRRCRSSRRSGSSRRWNSTAAKPRLRATCAPRAGSRLSFLRDVGLGYLSLDRSAPTLSGGEAQRIRLAAQLGSNLQGVCYVLDEPTIGLHPRDNRILLDSLERLGRKGNTLLVVEHDEETIRRADHLLDLGPGAGTRGGTVVGEGRVADLIASPDSVTGRFLANPLRHPLVTRRPVAPFDAEPRRARRDPAQPAPGAARVSRSTGSRSSPACRVRASRRSRATCCTRTCTRAPRRPAGARRHRGSAATSSRAPRRSRACWRSTRRRSARRRGPARRPTWVSGTTCASSSPAPPMPACEATDPVVFRSTRPAAAARRAKGRACRPSR